MTAITIDHLSHRYGKTTALDNISLTLPRGVTVGLIGPDGVGKSTLLALLRHEIDADSGDYRLPPDWRIASVAQETPALPDSAHDYVLAGHAPYQAALAAIAAAEASGDGHAIAKAHEQLAACDGYAQPARAAELLDGLGFPPSEQHRAVASYSGGWRMRLNLARALIAPAELLLLDEPTNHLDLDAIIWLQDYLKTLPVTQIIIAHDREFLDALCTRILNIENQRLTAYTGNYSDFERLRHEQRLQADAEYQKQARSRAHLQAYIDRFRAKASKARQAQSRLKALEKLDAAPPPPPEADYRLQFQSAEHHPNPVLNADALTLGYGDHTILSGIRLRIAADARIGILGRNGAGKSTFVHLLTREAFPLFKERPPVRFRGQDRPLLTDLKGALGIVSSTMHEQVRVHLPAIDIVCGGLFGTLGLPRHVTCTEMQRALGMAQLAKLGVGHVADRDIMTLSSGEARRVLVARELVHDPSVLIFDEPCTGLDPQGMYCLRETMSTLAREGRSVIIVTHYPEDIVPDVKRVVLMKDARIFADGPKERLLRSEPMSELFDVPLDVDERNGWYALRGRF